MCKACVGRAFGAARPWAPALHSECCCALHGQKAQAAPECRATRPVQGEGYSEEELPGSLVDELEHKISPEQRRFAAFQARVSGPFQGARRLPLQLRAPLSVPPPSLHPCARAAPVRR